MQWLVAYAKSSIGKKQVMAVTGILLLLFVIAHLAGNLTIFGGRDAMNSYAAGLRDLGPLLWLARLGLLAVFVLHIAAGASLYVHNRRARPTRYRVFKPQASTFYGRAMALSGIALLLYVAFHLAHFTFGFVQPGNYGLDDPLGRGDIYAMTVLGFQNPLISALYIASMAMLTMHLAHGIPSFFQTLGFRHPKYLRAIEIGGPALAVLLFIGYSAIPLSVMLGLLQP